MELFVLSAKTAQFPPLSCNINALSRRNAVTTWRLECLHFAAARRNSRSGSLRHELRVLGQARPTRPIRTISIFSAGNATDVTARVVLEVVSRQVGQSFVIDNRPGAGGRAWRPPPGPNRTAIRFC